MAHDHILFAGIFSCFAGILRVSVTVHRDQPYRLCKLIVIATQQSVGKVKLCFHQGQNADVRLDCILAHVTYISPFDDALINADASVPSCALLSEEHFVSHLHL